MSSSVSLRQGWKARFSAAAMVLIGCTLVLIQAIKAGLDVAFTFGRSFSKPAMEAKATALQLVTLALFILAVVLIASSWRFEFHTPRAGEAWSVRYAASTVGAVIVMVCLFYIYMFTATFPR